MEDPKLTIIIPLYNTERYISNCICSILNSADYDNFEIIVIDDGSTDKGPEIVQNLADKNTHIRLISQNNQGLSGARNTGIDKAKGDFIWFVDADDEATDQLPLIINQILSHKDLDFLAVVLRQVNANRELISFHYENESIKKNVVISGRDAIISGYSPSSACALIMRRQFLEDNNLRFKIGITHEDVEFTYRAMAIASKVMFTDIMPYLYFRRGDTMSTPHDRERLLKYVLDDIVIIESFYKSAEDYKHKDPELSNTIYKRARNTQFGLVLSSFTSRKLWSKSGILDDVLHEFKENNIIPLKGSFGDVKKNLFKYFLNIWTTIRS